ncbi:MAG: hypothetical protein FWC95_00660 [Defluviitaleaceae bacterium]|nr:hypothetical protein [Defluviitaleaceae bacterium]
MDTQNVYEAAAENFSISILQERKLLEMIIHAATDEAAATRFYTRLSERLTGEDRKTVHNIALDEAKHRRLFEDLYFRIAHRQMPAIETDKEEPLPENLPDIFEDRIYDENADIEFYRNIYFTLINMDYRDVMFEIMSDESRHASLLNLLYAKYKR